MLLVTIGYYLYIDLPRNVTHYKGLELGMAANEVMYKKGKPSGVYGKEETVNIENTPATVLPTIYSADIPKDSTVQNYKGWFFDDDKGNRLDVDFDVPNGHVIEIGCYSRAGSGCEMVNKLGINCTEADITKRLGKPSKEFY
jgi:hypothetical protein